MSTNPLSSPSSRRRRFDSVAFCGKQMFAICEEGRLWYASYNPGGRPWKEEDALPEIEDPVGPADHSRDATKMVQVARISGKLRLSLTSALRCLRKPAHSRRGHFSRDL